MARWTRPRDKGEVRWTSTEPPPADSPKMAMKLPGRFKISPQIAGAIKAVAGVVDVQQL